MILWSHPKESVIIDVKTRNVVFFVLVVLFVLTRSAVLLTEPTGAGFCEAFRATVAYDWITAHKFSVVDCAFRFNEGGSVVITFLIGIIFKLFGVSVLTLHLAPLLFSFLVFSLGYKTLLRFCGFTEAVFFGIFFVFMPQSYLSLSMIAWGTHVEAVLFVMLMLYCLCGIIAESNVVSFHKILYVCALGLTCGFSVWFCYTDIIAVIAVFICIAFFNRYFRNVHLMAVMLFAFFIGFIPLILFFVNSNGANLQVYSKPILSYFFLSIDMGVIEKSVLFLTRDLPLGMFYASTPPITREQLCGIYYALLIIAAIYWVRYELRMKKSCTQEARQCISVFSVAYMVVFWILYSIGDFAVDHSNIDQGKGFRYIAAFFPLFCIVFAMAISAVQGRLRRSILAAVVIAPCFWGLISIVKPNNLLVNTSKSPLSYQSFGWSIGEKYRNDFSRALSYYEKIDKPGWNFFFCGLAEGITPRFLDQPELLVADFHNIPELYRPGFYLYLGYHAFLNASEHMGKPFSQIALLDEVYKAFAYSGAGAYVATCDKDQVSVFMTAIPQQYHCAFFEGYGRGLAYLTGYNAERSIRSVIEDLQIPSEYKACAFKGISLGIVNEEFYNNDTFLASLVDRAYMVPEQYRGKFLEGLSEAWKQIKEQ